MRRSVSFSAQGVLAVVLAVGARTSFGGPPLAEYPPVAKPSADEAAQFGRNIQRTMTLLAANSYTIPSWDLDRARS
jgi:hypothetical protein